MFPGVLSAWDRKAPAAAEPRPRGGAAPRRRSAAKRRLPEQREQDGGEGEQRAELRPADAEEQPGSGDQAAADRSVVDMGLLLTPELTLLSLLLVASFASSHFTHCWPLLYTANWKQHSHCCTGEKCILCSINSYNAIKMDCKWCQYWLVQHTIHVNPIYILKTLLLCPLF